MVRIIHGYKDFSSVKRQFQWCVLYLGAYYNREITVFMDSNEYVSPSQALVNFNPIYLKFNQLDTRKK